MELANVLLGNESTLLLALLERSIPDDTEVWKKTLSIITDITETFICITSQDNKTAMNESRNIDLLKTFSHRSRK